MKLLRFILAIVLAFVPVSNMNAAGWLLLTKSTGTDANATAWAAAVVAAGGTVSANQLAYVSTLITAYKAAGVYTLLDEEWLYASENTFTAKVSIVSPYHSHTLVNTPAFTANRGYDSSGTGTGYIDTGYIAGTNYTLNAHSFGAYIFTSRITTSGATAVGTQSTAYSVLQPLQASGLAAIASGDNTFESPTNSQANGNYIITRTSSTNINYYKNAAAVQSFTVTVVAIPTVNWFVLAYNANGAGPNQPYPIGEIVASAFMGGVLNGTQAAAKNAALNTYMTSVGANVY